MHFKDNHCKLHLKRCEILDDLERTKDRLMCEMSELDKDTLTKLRNIVEGLDAHEKFLSDKINFIDKKIASLSVFDESVKNRYFEQNFLNEIQEGLNSNYVPYFDIVEMEDFYIININLPLTNSVKGQLKIGSLGKKISKTRRIPALLTILNSDQSHNFYNGYLQISGYSSTGDITVQCYDSTLNYQYIMATGIIPK